MLVPLNLQKTVNGLSLLAGKLGHSFCRSPRGCRKADFKPLVLKEAKYALERGGFTCSGTACQNQYALVHRCFYGKLLFFGIHYIIRFFNLFYFAVKCRMACRRKIQKDLYTVAYALFIAERLN